MKKHFGIYLTVGVFIITLVLMIMYGDTIERLAGYMSGMNMVSYIAYVLVLIIAVVAMPVTVMPLIPVAASLLGPFATALLSIVGWTVGGAIAFLIARYVARPIIERFVSLKRVDELAAQIPHETRFLTIVLLRLTLPVDLVSYALGLSKSIGFFEYVAATFVGVIWFSFAFAYMGDALLNKNIVLLIEIGAVSVLVFTIGWLLIARRRKKNTDSKK